VTVLSVGVVSIAALAIGSSATTHRQGVEHGDDLELLRRLGCDLAQGFHLARPLPTGDLLDWLERRRVGADAPTELDHPSG